MLIMDIITVERYSTKITEIVISTLIVLFSNLFFCKNMHEEFDYARFPGVENIVSFNLKSQFVLL